MRCLAICQDELVIKVLDEILLPSFEIEFLVDSRTLSRRLAEAGVHITYGDLRRKDTFLKADISPNTCVIVQDNGKRGLKRVLNNIRDAGGTLIYVLGVGTGASAEREEEIKSEFPDVTYLAMAELFGGPLLTEFGRSLTRARVQQYQRYFADADRVLILLHNDPDPDAMASGLALRNLLRRTKATAIIGAMQNVSRPENLRMANLLDIHVETVTPQDFEILRAHRDGGRSAALLHGTDRSRRPGDRSPSRAAGLQRDLQGHPFRLRIDLHDPDRAPARRGRQHLGAHGDGDALRHQVRHALLQPAGEPRRPRGVLVPLSAFRRDADSQDGRRGDHAGAAGTTSPRPPSTAGCEEQVFCAFLGEVPREDFIPYVADFFLQLEDVKWTIVAGIVNGSFVVSVRNLGYSRNAGELVRKLFADVGSAGGHRAMAKAVVPIERYRQKFGDLDPATGTETILELALQFLHESNAAREGPGRARAGEGNRYSRT